MPRPLTVFVACEWCERVIEAPREACPKGSESSRRALSAAPDVDPVCKEQLKARGY